jgi:hypothetical protein
MKKPETIDWVRAVVETQREAMIIGAFLRWLRANHDYAAAGQDSLDASAGLCSRHQRRTLPHESAHVRMSRSTLKA